MEHVTFPFLHIVRNNIRIIEEIVSHSSYNILKYSLMLHIVNKKSLFVKINLTPGIVTVYIIKNFFNIFVISSRRLIYRLKTFID